MKAHFNRYILDFKRPSGTSRGVLNTKETWFLELEHEGKIGIGECAVFRGLSSDDVPDYQLKLKWLCDHIAEDPQVLLEKLKTYPSIQFGLETALRSLSGEEPFVLYPSAFTEGRAAISINGLVWMGDFEYMRSQIIDKIHEGFTCIKLKIGAIAFDEELKLLSQVRREFAPEDLELRVDANGAFSPQEALEKLKYLSDYHLHSIEQPIRQGQWQDMAYLCEQSPLAIALDEELIGIFDLQEKKRLLEQIQPQYIILKPALVGGFRGSTEWIDLAESTGIDWWITSALESNIGLNAIAQWTFSLNNPMAQGLGTGGLFTNNFASPLAVKNGKLHYRPAIDWQYKK
jgi:o-succinylbenzoate synthase